MPKNFLNLLAWLPISKPSVFGARKFKEAGFIFIFILLNITQSNIAAAAAAEKKEPFFTCESGYQFESKQKSARCVKKKRLSHRPPNACAKNKGFKLAVDKKGVQDLCVVVGNNQGTNKKLKIMLPDCSKGYRLQSRRGKDSCVQEQKENIKPPTKKVRR